MKEVKNPGYLVISLDFELFWGMFDKTTIKEYGANIIGERIAIPRMLSLFEEYGIHATWATVGMLMARSRDELYALLPKEDERPRYAHMPVSAYEYLRHTPIGRDEAADKYHFGASLVRTILATPYQEIANHTFSHFYCIDGVKNHPSIFKKDLELHQRIAQTYVIHTESIVFPRNQTTKEALSSCVKFGIHAYRGNENHFLYRARKDTEQSSFFIRLLRLIDHYINISGFNTYSLPKKIHPDTILNIPSSRFLRPWNRVLQFFEPLRMRRINNAMTHAAKHGEIFHLWWHPHNFGINQEQNFENLITILEHFKKLQKEYNMQSASMRDITALANQK